MKLTEVFLRMLHLNIPRLALCRPVAFREQVRWQTDRHTQRQTDRQTDGCSSNGGHLTQAKGVCAPCTKPMDWDSTGPLAQQWPWLTMDHELPTKAVIVLKLEIFSTIPAWWAPKSSNQTGLIYSDNVHCTRETEEWVFNTRWRALICVRT